MKRIKSNNKEKIDLNSYNDSKSHMSIYDVLYFTNPEDE